MQYRKRRGLGADALTTVVGLCGKSCSGKNYLSSLLEQKGWESIDVDVLGHDVINTEAREVAKLFGQDAILPDGKVNRKAVGKIVFSNPKMLRKLERLLHPQMVRMVQQKISETNASVVLVNAALLHRMGMDKICDAVIYVKSPFKVRFQRARKRDNVSLKDFINRTKSQKDINSRSIDKSCKVYVVNNPFNESKIHRQVARLCDKIVERKHYGT